MYSESTITMSPVEHSIESIQYGGGFMVVVGIDVAKDKHDCIILGENKDVLVPTFTIANDINGFEQLYKAMLSVARDLSEIRVGLEACGHYAFSIVGWLEGIGLTPCSFQSAAYLQVQRIIPQEDKD